MSFWYEVATCVSFVLQICFSCKSLGKSEIWRKSAMEVRTGGKTKLIVTQAFWELFFCCCYI